MAILNHIIKVLLAKAAYVLVVRNRLQRRQPFLIVPRFLEADRDRSAVDGVDAGMEACDECVLHYAADSRLCFTRNGTRVVLLVAR